MTEPAQVFKYVQPHFERGKRLVRLCRGEHMIAAIQIVRQGGETNLHAHPHMDGFWMVISGRARFYSDVDTVVAELASYEGIFIPKGFKYSFESISDEPLEILQVESSAIDFDTLQGRERRVDFTPQTRADPDDFITDGIVTSLEPSSPA